MSGSVCLITASSTIALEIFQGKAHKKPGTHVQLLMCDGFMCPPRQTLTQLVHLIWSETLTLLESLLEHKITQQTQLWYLTCRKFNRTKGVAEENTVTLREPRSDKDEKQDT